MGRIQFAGVVDKNNSEGIIMKRSYTLGNRKVAIIGSGFVGSSIAYALAIRDVA